MKSRYYTLLYAAALLAAASCDISEEAYYPGPEPADVISTDVAELHLNADGTAATLDVSAICYWDAALADNENVFDISASTDRGDGTVTVKASRNYGQDVKTSTLVLTARNFDKQVKVDLIQSSLTFSMDAADYKTTPQQGGDVDLAFNSTTAWELLVRPNSSDPDDLGSLDWLEFTPGTTGDGSYYKTQVTASWRPNYTTTPRVITLVLSPVNQEILSYLKNDIPQPFTLVQEAGTLPENVGVSLGEPDYTSCPVAVSYESKAPVEEWGVELIDGSGDIQVKTLGSGSDLPASGTVNATLTGLSEGVKYSALPYVVSKVGKSYGEPATFTTKIGTPVYNGVKITDYAVTPSSRQVSVEVYVESDVDITEGGISISDMGGNHIVTYTNPLQGSRRDFVVESTDFMTPNTQYMLEIFARTQINEDIAGPIIFTTKGLTPEEGDNNPPQ